MSAWLIGLFFGAIDAVLLFELGFYGLLFTLAFIGLAVWKGPRLPALSGLVTGVGLVWTLLLARVALDCAIESLTPGSGCDPPGIGPWIAGAAVILGIGAIATVVAARHLRVR
jgi:hypothetical protein